MRKNILFALLVGFIAFTSCKREYDEPPQNTIPTGGQLTVTDLRNLYTGTPLRITGDSSVYGIVIADEATGNFYKEVYITDGASGLNVRLMSSGGLYEGDSIRIYLPGTVLSEYNNMLQLDSVDVDENVVILANNVDVSPTVTTIDQINSTLQGQLIKLENVEFILAEQGLSYADGTNQISENRTLTDCIGQQVLVRTSGFADFADDILPGGNGDFIGIVGQFNTDMQLYVRRTSELAGMTATLCGGLPPGTYMNKDWEDMDLTSGGWMTYLVTGTLNWIFDSFGADNFAKMTNWNGSNNEVNETWLISPGIDLTGATNPGLSFRTAYNYSGDPLEVYVSSDYDGSSDPNVSGTWTQLSPTLSSGSWTWVSSGVIDVSAYAGSSAFYVGFKYTGGASDGSTWEVDDVLLQEY